MRYGFQSLTNVVVTGSMTLAGPQNEDQVPQEIKDLLQGDNVEFVAVLTKYNGIHGARIYNKIEE